MAGWHRRSTHRVAGRVRWSAGCRLLAAGVLLAGCASEPKAPPEEPAAATEQAPESAGAPGAEDAPETTPAPDTEAGEAGPVAAERTGDGLGLHREEIVGVLTRYDLAADAFEALDLENGREVLAASYPASVQRQVLWIGIFGEPADPHTVRIDFFPERAQGTETQAAGDAIARLMMALFPDWSDAARWPEVAGNRAWQETAKAMQDEADAPARAPVIEGQRDGAWLASLGVPPRVISYVITTRDACRPSQGEGFYQGYPACR